MLVLRISYSYSLIDWNYINPFHEAAGAEEAGETSMTMDCISDLSSRREVKDNLDLFASLY